MSEHASAWRKERLLAGASEGVVGRTWDDGSPGGLKVLNP